MIGKIKRLAQTIQENKRLLKELTVKQEEIKRISLENYWANVFNSAVRGSRWAYHLPLNVGRWAAGYSLFYVLFRILNEVEPDSVLELGLGETTKMIQAYKTHLKPDALCVTVEHDSNWIQLKKEAGIAVGQIEVLQAELEEMSIEGKPTLRYKNLTELVGGKQRQYQLIIIDGPFGSANYSRSNIIDLVSNGFLADEFILILDDYNRKGEQETIVELKEVLSARDVSFVEGVYHGDKSFVLLASERYRFLTSL